MSWAGSYRDVKVEYDSDDSWEVNQPLAGAHSENVMDPNQIQTPIDNVTGPY